MEEGEEALRDAELNRDAEAFERLIAERRRRFFSYDVSEHMQHIFDHISCICRRENM
jgi:hypothetical protein